MAEVQGFKIVRPGVHYYFDDKPLACPYCTSNDLEYRYRVQGTPRTARFKCRSCLCEFEKTRLLETEPEGYTPGVCPSDGILAVACPGCGHQSEMKLSEFVNAARVDCPVCGVVLKDRTGQQA